MFEVIVPNHTKTCAIYLSYYTFPVRQIQEVALCKSPPPSQQIEIHSRYPIEIEAVVSWKPCPKRDYAILAGGSCILLDLSISLFL